MLGSTPVARLKDPTARALYPVCGNPHPARMRRNRPVASHPDVAYGHRVPAIVAGHPDMSRARRRAIVLHDHRRWGDLDVDAGCLGRPHAAERQAERCDRKEFLRHLLGSPLYPRSPVAGIDGSGELFCDLVLRAVLALLPALLHPFARLLAHLVVLLLLLIVQHRFDAVFGLLAQLTDLGEAVLSRERVVR